MSAVAEPEMTVVEYQVAAHLRSHIAVVTAVEMKTSSVVLRSGTRSAAGNLVVRAHDSHSSAI